MLIIFDFWHAVPTQLIAGRSEVKILWMATTVMNGKMSSSCDAPPRIFEETSTSSLDSNDVSMIADSFEQAAVSVF